MSSQVSTSNEGEGNFNFDNWIIKHDLVEVKELFVKHNVTTTNALKFTSTEFKSLMIDPTLFTKSHTIPKIMDAMQTMSKESIIKVVIGEDEQKVIDTIEANLKGIDKFEAVSNKLNDDLPKSILRINNEKLKQINITINKVNKTFDNILNIVKRKKENILNKLDDIKLKINNSSTGNDNKNNDDDEKEVDLILNIKDNIKKSRQFLQKQSQICDELTSSNKNRLQRKQKIINIGKSVKEKYNKTQKVLNDNIANVNKSIKCNNDTIVNIDFIINDKKYNKTIEYMNDIGIIINKTYNKTEITQNNKYLFVDEHENKIKELKNKLKQQNEERLCEISKNTQIIKELNDKINNKNIQNQALEQQINDANDQNQLLQQQLNSKTIQYNKIRNDKQLKETQLISSLSFNINDKYRWYSKDDEKQVNIKLGKISDDEKQIVFIDGTKNKNVLKQNLLIQPKVSKSHKNNYNKIIKCINILKDNAIITLGKHKITNSQDETDEWDTKLKHDGFTISQNVVTKTNSSWRTVFLSKIVDRGKHKWMFKIKTYAGSNNVMFGIWNNSHDPKEALDQYLTQTALKSYALYTWANNARLRTYDGNYGDDYGTSVKAGDVIEMKIDLDALTLSYSINDKDYGVAFNITRSEYRAGISILDKHSSVELINHD